MTTTGLSQDGPIGFPSASPLRPARPAASLHSYYSQQEEGRSPVGGENSRSHQHHHPPPLSTKEPPVDGTASSDSLPETHPFEESREAGESPEQEWFQAVKGFSLGFRESAISLLPESWQPLVRQLIDYVNLLLVEIFIASQGSHTPPLPCRQPAPTLLGDSLLPEDQESSLGNGLEFEGPAESSVPGGRKGGEEEKGCVSREEGPGPPRSGLGERFVFLLLIGIILSLAGHLILAESLIQFILPFYACFSWFSCFLFWIHPPTPQYRTRHRGSHPDPSDLRFPPETLRHLSSTKDWPAVHRSDSLISAELGREEGGKDREWLRFLLLLVAVAEIFVLLSSCPFKDGGLGRSVITHLSPLGCFVLLLLWFNSTDPPTSPPTSTDPLSSPRPTNTTTFPGSTGSGGSSSSLPTFPPGNSPSIALTLTALYVGRVFGVRTFLSLPHPLRPFASLAANLLALMAAPHLPAPLQPPGAKKEVSFSIPPPSRSGSDASSKGPPPSSSHRFTGLTDAEVSRSFTSQAKNRRTSLPASAGSLLASRAQSNVSEARGLIGELLQNKELGGQVVACLKAVNSLLSPANPATLTPSDWGLPSVVHDPYSGEDIVVGPGSKSRSGMVTWSTVTGATGLPTIEPEPSRSRSSSFWKNDEEEMSKASSARTSSEQATFVAMDGKEFNQLELEADEELTRIGAWDFPIFSYAQNNPHTVLTRMAYAVFSAGDLFQVFKISYQKFFNFFHSLEKGYWEIPYHNRIHATDVVHGCYYLTSHTVEGAGGDPLSSTMSSLELLSLFTAAAMHDFDHPGRTNAFLVASKDPKAILYNDRSVLENHHSAAAFRLLSRPENNFVEGLEPSEFKRFRYLTIELILATDLKRHFEILMEFTSKVKSGEGLDWEEEADKLLSCEMVIKLSDINSPTKPFDLHTQWTDRIIKEFHNQGDAEQALNLPVSPYMDRADPQIPKLQDSFISHLVLPLVTAMNEGLLLPIPEGASDSELISNIKSNHEVWKDRLPASPEESPSKEVPKEKEMTTIEENEDEEPHSE